MKTRQKVRRALAIASTATFPITLYYFSPVLSLSGLAAGIVTGSLAMFGVLFLVSLVLGRAFCGWVCPAGAVQEAVRGFKGRAVGRHSIQWIKWVIWAPWVLGLALVTVRAGGVREIDLTWMTWHGISVTDVPGVIALVSVTGLMAGLALAVGRRAACHTVCWMAPFMILAARLRNAFGWPSLRLEADSTTCGSCGTCAKACPMSLEVPAMVEAERMESPDCILCASCADFCPRGVIRLTFRSGH